MEKFESPESRDQSPSSNKINNSRTYTIKKRKRVMVVIDRSREAEAAMSWALSHVVYDTDILFLLHVLPPLSPRSPQARGALYAARDPQDTRRRLDLKACWFANSLKAFCKQHRPEVVVETVVVEGGKDDTGCVIASQAKKLQVSLLVLGQPKHSFLQRMLLRGSREDRVEYCIQKVECMTVAVRKQSGDLGGYLIRTRELRSFWMLA